jgi:hypothetical protein
MAIATVVDRRVEYLTTSFPANGYGGSFLCANSCLRYQPAAQQPRMVESPPTHIGSRGIVRPGDEVS